MTQKERLGRAALINTDDLAPLPRKVGSANPPIQMMQLQSENKRLKESVGRGLMLKISDLEIVPGRQRQLSKEEFGELLSNLREQDLATPITVVRTPNGKYQLVSGHNRVAAYRELNRTEIAAWVADSEAENVEELAFYANLLHPSLPDLEKYVGLTKVAAAPGGSIKVEWLAARTGMSETKVKQLLKFDGLPSEALEYLRQNPAKLGSEVAAKFVALTNSGKEKEVIAAVKALVFDGIEQRAALEMVTTTAVLKPAKKEVIKAGREVFCTVHSAAKVMRISFATEDDRIEVEAAVQEVLQRQATLRKEGKKT